MRPSGKISPTSRSCSKPCRLSRASAHICRDNYSVDLQKPSPERLSRGMAGRLTTAQRYLYIFEPIAFTLNSPLAAYSDVIQAMRKSILFISVLLVLSYQAWIHFQKPDVHYHNVVGCKIIDNDGTLLWALPAGVRCVFFDDGSVLAAIHDQLVMYDKDLKISWRKNIFSHHQLNRTDHHILVMTDEHIQESGELIRYDILQILDFSGNILNTFKISALTSNWYPKTEKKYWNLVPYKKNNRTVSKEFSHFNSFYMLQENSAEKNSSAFAKGNYIVSDLRGKIFTLDRDLKTVLWEMTEVEGMRLRTHDAQLTRQGNIVYYFNNAWGKQSYTTLDEVDPFTRKRRILFQEDPPELFFALVKGGLQILENGNILTSDTSHPPRAFEIDPTTQELVWSYQPKNLSDIQQIKRYDLSRFLQKNKGL